MTRKEGPNFTEIYFQAKEVIVSFQGHPILLSFLQKNKWGAHQRDSMHYAFFRATFWGRIMAHKNYLLKYLEYLWLYTTFAPIRSRLVDKKQGKRREDKGY